MTYVPEPQPTLEMIAKMVPIPFVETRPIVEIIPILNQEIERAGIEFGENDFSAFRDPNGPKTFEQARWVTASAVRGSNEGYYVYITVIPKNWDRNPSQVIASAKTWCWPSALAIAAAATRLLNP